MSMEKGTRTRLATALILFLVLTTGSVLGIAVDRRLEARGASGGEVAPEEDGRRSRGTRSAGEGEDSSSGSRSSLLVEQVGLSQDQQAQVDSIVAHYRQKMRELQDELQDELRQAYQPRYRGLLEETRQDLRAVLTPDQQMAYDSLLVEHDRRREERRRQDSISDSRG